MCHRPQRFRVDGGQIAQIGQLVADALAIQNVRGLPFGLFFGQVFFQISLSSPTSASRIIFSAMCQNLRSLDMDIPVLRVVVARHLAGVKFCGLLAAGGQAVGQGRVSHGAAAQYHNMIFRYSSPLLSCAKACDLQRF